MEGLPPTEELRKRPAESRPPEYRGIWLTEGRQRNSVHMKALGWGLRPRLQVELSHLLTVGSLWLPLFSELWLLPCPHPP